MVILALVKLLLLVRQIFFVGLFVANAVWTAFFLNLTKVHILQHLHLSITYCFPLLPAILHCCCLPVVFVLAVSASASSLADVQSVDVPLVDVADVPLIFCCRTWRF